MRKLYISITLILLILLSSCNISNYIIGRPLDFNDDSFLIGDRSNLKAHVWVEITSDTDISDNSLDNIKWGELGRYLLKTEITDLDKSSYPYTAKAKSIKVVSRDSSNFVGVAVKVYETSFLASGIDGGLMSVSIDEDTKIPSILIKNKDSYHVNDIIKVGDLVEFKYNYVLESNPGQTTARKIVNVEKFYVPDPVKEYLGEDATFIGMQSVFGLSRKIVPLYTNYKGVCTDHTKTYEEYKMTCASFENYTILNNNEIISLEAAFNEKFLHPSHLRTNWHFNFKIDESYYTNYGDTIFEVDDVYFKIKLYNLQTNDERYFLEYSDFNTDNPINFHLYCSTDTIEDKLFSRRTPFYEVEEITNYLNRNCISYVIKGRRGQSEELYKIGEFKIS